MFSENGYDADAYQLKGHAENHAMLVAMANYNKPTGNWIPAGKSAIWSEKGLLATANESQDALVIAHHDDNSWVGSVIDI